jgi:hypothetical protein
MLDMRRITAATAVVGALALPATATADSDGSDGYRGLGAQAVESGTHALPDAADGYRGLGRQPDTRATPVVQVIDAPDEQFKWGDAGIGAAGSLAVIAIVGGIAVVATGRRRSARDVATTS